MTKSVSLAAAVTLATLSFGASAQAQSAAGCSPNNWGMMNYGVCYHVNDPYAETSGNWAAHGAHGLYGSNTYGETHWGTDQNQGFWMDMKDYRYDSVGRLNLQTLRR